MNVNNKNCGNCVHWGGISYKNGTIKKCNNTPMFWDATKWDDEGETRIVKPEYINNKAFVQDGSDYKADLLTMAGFCCNQHTDK